MLLRERETVKICENGLPLDTEKLSLAYSLYDCMLETGLTSYCCNNLGLFTL